jgi:hypothetical protein
MLIELGISPDYCPDWTEWHAIRDITQNYMDAAAKSTSCDIVEGTSDGIPYIRWINHGVDFDKRAFLIGFSTKRGDDSQRGQYGEGLKISVLVLHRLGYDVKIQYGQTVWSPAITMSRDFGTQVLAFAQSNARPHGPKTFSITVKKKGLSWFDYVGRFLTHQRPIPGIRYVSGYNAGNGQSVLTDPEFRGMAFCNGIYVCQLPGFKYGYNFSKSTITLNRDRDSIGDWEAKYAAAQLLAYALNCGSFPVEELVKNCDASDISQLYLFMTPDIRSSFQELHGNNAVPVTSEEVARKAESVGLVPKMVSQDAYRWLSKSVNPDQEIETLERVSKRASLTPESRAIERMLRDIFSQDSQIDDVAMVEFSGPGTVAVLNGNTLLVSIRHALTHVHTEGLISSICCAISSDVELDRLFRLAYRAAQWRGLETISEDSYVFID